MTSSNGISRRQALRLGLAVGVAGPLVYACGGGFSTSGGGGGGGQLTFVSTQFAPVQEKERFRKILADAYPSPVNFVTNDAGPFTTQVRSQVDAGKVEIHLLGGLHGDLAPLADGHLEDLTDLYGQLGDKGYSEDMRTLAKAGSTDRIWYIPWAQATYVVAVHKKALVHLPSSANVNDLTYDQFLAWAQAAKANTGAPQLGLPGGPKGLLHRFLQGYLYPSFTGGQVTTFRSQDAVSMWVYLKDLWANCAPASTNFDFMQEPLATGQVTVAWDHVARLVNAPKDKPDDWLMVPAPKGPKGRGYMTVLLGLAIPKGAPDQDKTKELIKALSQTKTQFEVLRQNAFFPTVKAAETPSDLPPAVRLEAGAVRAQIDSSGARVALPPVGLGQKDGEMSKIYKDSFTAIVLQNADIRATLDAQAKNMQALLDGARASCWPPDEPVSGQNICQVG